MKQCNNCKQEKPLDAFYKVNKRNKPTIYHICITCCATQKKDLKSYYRDWELKKKYGISIETYLAQCSLRNNICDICKEAVETLHVDHCHRSMKVRGYLCGSCNRGIGLLKESPSVLKSALEYVKNHD